MNEDLTSCEVGTLINLQDSPEENQEQKLEVKVRPRDKNIDQFIEDAVRRNGERMDAMCKQLRK